jgi:Spy/CpxP family protein refolding chaperone
MKYFKKINLVLLTGFLLISFNLFAQRGNMPSPEERAKRQVENLKTELTLTDEQIPKVEKIYLDANKKMSEMRANSGGNREGMRDKMMAINKKRDEEMKKVLTAEQFTKYQKYLEEQRANRPMRNR